MNDKEKEIQSNHNFKMVKIYLLTGIITLLSIPILGIFSFLTPVAVLLIIAYLLPKDDNV